jgi:phosphotransferase system  glucose/maltose/N-acetylglucosamine-specific IIC component
MNSFKLLSVLAIIVGAILALTIYPILYFFFGKTKEANKESQNMRVQMQG